MDLLRKAGLKKYESKIYESILRFGPGTANDISDNSSVPKTAVYPNLKSLISKGLIQEIKGKISTFSALPPSIAIKALFEKKEESIMMLKSELIDSLESIKGKGNPIKLKEVLLLTRGRIASSEFYYKNFQLAKKTFFILGWRFEKVGEKYNLLREMSRLVKRGVDVRILVTSSKERVNLPLLADYREKGIKVKRINLDNFSIVIVDSKECKITLKDRSIGEKFNISIVDDNLSKAMNNYFLDCWSRALDV